jgi:hypothetical protein
MENVFTLKEILLKLIDNSKLKLYFACEGMLREINITEYFCKMFQILVRYQNMAK